MIPTRSARIREKDLGFSRAIAWPVMAVSGRLQAAGNRSGSKAFFSISSVSAFLTLWVVVAALGLELVWPLGGATALALVPYESYTYNPWGEPVPAPLPYVPRRVIEGRTLGIGQFRSPQDVFVGSDQTVYLLDSGNNRIVHLDSEFQLLRVIDGFERDGVQESFRSPRGLFVTDGGVIYVADTENGRIVELGPDGRLLRVIPAPGPEHAAAFPQGFVYRPTKLVVDDAGRIFVIARDQYEGIMEFNADGEFQGFVGAPRVTPSLVDVLWSRIATEEQRERQALFLPTLYSGIDIDENGFLFVTKQGSADEGAIKKLNPAGRDVLVRKGFHPVPGDIWYYRTDVTATGPSTFVDIVAREHGIYSALDRNRGRVFTYDENGRLLYVFGSRGSQFGALNGPVALDVLADRTILVVDELKNQLIVFEPTRYANLIHSAIALYEAGYYDESEALWRRVLDLNANYDLAYIGVGRARYRKGDFVQAMVNFRLGHDRSGYSDAFRMYRRQVIEENFSLFATVVATVGFLVYLVRRRWGAGRATGAPGADEPAYANVSLEVERGLWAALKYSLYVIVRPFDGFYRLKHERRGNAAAASVILVLVIFTFIAVRQYTGFIFNPRKIEDLNVIIEALSVLVPFGLWTVVNWAFTTLMDGKGTMKDVYIASAYALVPIVVIYVPLTLVSNVLIQEEGALYYLFLTLGLVWTVWLLFVGTMVTHDYTVSKTVLSTACILAGMGFVLFVFMLSYEIVGSAIGFVTGLYNEITFRL